jgi:hypothetical protein
MLCVDAGEDDFVVWTDATPINSCNPSLLSSGCSLLSSVVFDAGGVCCAANISMHCVDADEELGVMADMDGAEHALTALLPSGCSH